MVGALSLVGFDRVQADSTSSVISSGNFTMHVWSWPLATAFVFQSSLSEVKVAERRHWHAICPGSEVDAGESRCCHPRGWTGVTVRQVLVGIMF